MKSRKSGKNFIKSDDKYGKWEQSAVYQLNLQKGHFPEVEFPIQQCLSIHAIIYYWDRVGRDNSNVVESIHDALVRAGVIADDNWKVTGPTKQTPVLRLKEPGCKVVIELPYQKGRSSSPPYVAGGGAGAG